MEVFGLDLTVIAMMERPSWTLDGKALMDLKSKDCQK